MEHYREEESIFSSNGKKYDLNIIFAAVAKDPILSIPISRLVWVLDYVEVVDDPRIEAADISVPILVTFSRGKELVIDGLHRLLKAKDLNIKTLPYRRVSKVLFDYAQITRPDHNFKAPHYFKW